MQHRDEVAVFRDLHVSAYGLVIRSAQLCNVIETNFVAASVDDFADIHPHIFLSLIAGYDSHAGDERRDAEVREMHSVEAARRRLDPIDKTRSEERRVGKEWRSRWSACE